MFDVLSAFGSLAQIVQLWIEHGGRVRSAFLEASNWLGALILVVAPARTPEVPEVPAPAGA